MAELKNKRKRNRKRKLQPLFLEIPMRNLTKFKLEKSKDSRFYKSFVQSYNRLDDSNKCVEEDALLYLVKLHNDIIKEYLPRINDGGLYVLLTGILDTIQTICNMCKDYTNIHRVKVANFSMRLIVEDTYRFYFNHKCTYNIWDETIPNEWYDHLGKYNCGAHCNYTKFVYSVNIMKDDIVFCIDKITERLQGVNYNG